MSGNNATFHAFKTSGKWYTTGRGYLAPEVFSVFTTEARRRAIVEGNSGKYPGLSGEGSEFVFIVIGDDSLDYGYPLMLYPAEVGR